MKLYLHDGTYFEKQADCPTRSFKAVEFDFSASPKADFVAWMNQLDYGPGVSTRIADPGRKTELFDEHAKTDLMDDELPVDRHVREQAAQPKPAVSKPRGPQTVDTMLEWLLDEASNAEVENIFSTLGARFHEARKL